MGVKALGYVIVETAQPERWDTFLTQLAGVMRAPDAADGAMQFRIDERLFRFRIEQSDRDWFKAAAYEVADAAELDALAARIAAALSSPRFRPDGQSRHPSASSAARE